MVQGSSNLEVTSKFYAPETGQAASNLQIDGKYLVPPKKFSFRATWRPGHARNKRTLSCQRDIQKENV